MGAADRGGPHGLRRWLRDWFGAPDGPLSGGYTGSTGGVRNLASIAERQGEQRLGDAVPPAPKIQPQRATRSEVRWAIVVGLVLAVPVLVAAIIALIVAL